MYTMMPINEQGYPSLTRGGASLTRAGASLTRGGAGVSPHGFVTSPTSGYTHHPHQPLPPAGHRSSRRSSMKKQRHRSEQAQAGAGYFIRLANSSPMIKNNSSPSMTSPSAPESPQYWTLPCTAFAVKKALKSFMPRSLPQTPLNRRLGSSFRTLTSSFRSPQPPSTAVSASINNNSNNQVHGSPAAAIAASLPAATPPSSTTTSLPASPAIAKTAKLPTSSTFDVKTRVVDVDKVAKSLAKTQLAAEEEGPLSTAAVAAATPTESSATQQQKQQQQQHLPSSASSTSAINASQVKAMLTQFSMKDALLYQDGILLSGSLGALIQHLVPTKDYYPEKTYVFAFLLTSRIHIPPHQLMEEVTKICRKQQKIESEGESGDADSQRQQQQQQQQQWSEGALGDFGVHIIKLLNQWISTFPQDFRDETMMRNLMAFTKALEHRDRKLCSELSQLRASLLSRLSVLDLHFRRLGGINDIPPRTTMPSVHVASHLLEICKDAKVVAQQLTHVELERLKFIGPEEFMKAFIKAGARSSVTGDCEALTSRLVGDEGNIDLYVDWFNRLSYFVATEVCMHRKKRHRVMKINFLVDVAKECYNIGNFNSLMAILAGLNLAPVLRLRKTWAKIDREKLNALEHQMDPSQNFYNYRSALKAAKWRSTGDWGFQGKIIVPFFSVLVKDIYYINQGCSNTVPDNGHLNFNKFWQMAKRVSEFMAWQQTECFFERDETVLNYLTSASVYDDDSLSLASYECQSPDFSPDKEHHKTLKSERPQ